VTYEQIRQLLLDYRERRDRERPAPRLLYQGKSRHYETKCRLKWADKFFAGWKAIDITEAALFKYRDWRLQTITQRGGPPTGGTVNREVLAIQKMFTLAIRAKLLPLTRKVSISMEERLPEPPPKRSVSTPQALEAVIAALPVGVDGRMEYLCRADMEQMLRIAFVWGWRTEDLLYRRRKHLFEVDGTLFLEIPPGQGKTGKQRVVPLDGRVLRPIIDAQLAHVRRIEVSKGIVTGQDGWLFPRRDGQAMGRQAFDNAFKRAAAKAGYPDLRPHDFRRTATTGLEDAGVPLMERMQMVGHETLSVHRGYSILTAKRLIANGTIDRVNDYQESLFQSVRPVSS
jgi:integrase